VFVLFTYETRDKEPLMIKMSWFPSPATIRIKERLEEWEYVVVLKKFPSITFIKSDFVFE
jgi:hypothetical protein